MNPIRQPAVGDLGRRLHRRLVAEAGGEAGAKVGAGATLETIVVEGAMDALRKGDADRHNALIAARAPELAHCDAIMLAHFSTSRALAAVNAAVGTPVLTAPDAAVDRIRAAIAG